MTTDNRTNEPTAEQILVDEWIRQADRAKSMTGMDAIWFPDAEETLAVLRANGLLSEGAPSEEQVEAAAKAMHETRNPWFAAYGDWGAAGFEIKRAFRESARAALVAAHGAAPQAHYSEPVMSAPQVESEDNVMCRCGHGTGSHDFSDPQEPCREIVCDCRGWFGVSPVLPSSDLDEDKLAEAWEAGCLAGGNRKHHTNMTEEQAEKAWPNPYREGQVDTRG